MLTSLKIVLQRCRLLRKVDFGWNLFRCDASLGHVKLINLINVYRGVDRFAKERKIEKDKKMILCHYLQSEVLYFHFIRNLKYLQYQQWF